MSVKNSCERKQKCKNSPCVLKKVSAAVLAGTLAFGVLGCGQDEAAQDGVGNKLTYWVRLHPKLTRLFRH